MSTSAMHVAKTGLTAQQYKMQVIAKTISQTLILQVLREIEQILSLYFTK